MAAGLVDTLKQTIQVHSVKAKGVMAMNGDGSSVTVKEDKSDDPNSIVNWATQLLDVCREK